MKKISLSYAQENAHLDCIQVRHHDISMACAWIKAFLIV